MIANNSRITIEPGKRGGKPCIRGLRITVNDILGWLASGMTEQEILEEHPALEKADFAAARSLFYKDLFSRRSSVEGNFNLGIGAGFSADDSGSYAVGV